MAIVEITKRAVIASRKSIQEEGVVRPFVGTVHRERDGIVPHQLRSARDGGA